MEMYVTRSESLRYLKETAIEGPIDIETLNRYSRGDFSEEEIEAAGKYLMKNPEILEKIRTNKDLYYL